MNILIAYDGSECGRAALSDLQPTGLPTDAEVRGIKRFLLGSVSTAVAMNARCSVEIVRPRRGPAARSA